ncbi:mATE efflux family protein [Roseburia sp. CAG:471]|nr:mATE efflux family protein [Roseburia sp. CAG:471]
MAEAIGTSLGTFTGQNVGANHLDRVKQGVRCAYLMNAVCYGIFCPVIWFFARPIMEAFTGNPESIRYGVEYMKIFSCFFFVGGILVVYHNILRSAGDVTITVLMGVSEIITRIGCTFLFTAVFGYYGLWWVSPLTWCCAMLVGCVRYYSGKWKKKVQLQRGDSIHG